MPYVMILDDVAGYEPDVEDESELRELADKYVVSLQALTLRMRNVVGNAFC